MPMLMSMLLARGHFGKVPGNTKSGYIRSRLRPCQDSYLCRAYIRCIALP